MEDGAARSPRRARGRALRRLTAALLRRRGTVIVITARLADLLAPASAPVGRLALAPSRLRNRRSRVRRRLLPARMIHRKAAHAGC